MIPMTTQDMKHTADPKPVGQARAGPEPTEATVVSMATFASDATNNARTAAQAGMGAAADGMRRASDQFTRFSGFDGEEGRRLAERSTLNMDAVRACNAVAAHAFQEFWRDWFSLAQRQMQRNVSAFGKLSQARSVQDYLAVQSDLIRDSMQHITEDSGAMARHSIKAVEDATDSIGKVAPGPTARVA